MSNQFIPIERDKPCVIPVQAWLPTDHLALIRWLERHTLHTGTDLSAEDLKAVKATLTARWRVRQDEVRESSA